MGAKKMNEEFLEAFKGAVSSIQRNERFTDGFKSFSIASFLIIDLCNIFEEGTERKITKENIYEDKGIFNFIKAIIPLLKMKDICSSIAGGSPCNPFSTSACIMGQRS